MILVADIAPQNAKIEATVTTAVVVPDQLTIDPMHIDNKN